MLANITLFDTIAKNEHQASTVWNISAMEEWGSMILRGGASPYMGQSYNNPSGPMGGYGGVQTEQQAQTPMRPPFSTMIKKYIELVIERYGECRNAEISRNQTAFEEANKALSKAAAALAQRSANFQYGSRWF